MSDKAKPEPLPEVTVNCLHAYLSHRNTNETNGAVEYSFRLITETWKGKRGKVLSLKSEDNKYYKSSKRLDPGQLMKIHENGRYTLEQLTFDVWCYPEDKEAAEKLIKDRIDELTSELVKRATEIRNAWLSQRKSNGN